MKKVGTTNTKAQILEAYDELMKKLQEKSADNPVKIQEREKQVKIVENAQSITEKGIIEDIAVLKENFLDSLEKVQHNLTDEYKKLAEIQEAIKIEKKNLEELYGISTNTNSLAAILLAQKESRKQFEEEMTTTRTSFNTEMQQIKSKWHTEKEAYELQQKEAKEFQNKFKKREEEEYSYSLQQKRTKDTDEYETKKSKQETELKDEKIAFEKAFSAREKTIKENEQEYAILKKTSEIFPEEIEKEVSQAQKELGDKLTTEFKFQQELTAKESEGLLNLKNLEITSLKEKVKEMETQIKSSNQKAEISEKSVKDIALKAIESSTKMQIVRQDKRGEE